MKRLIVLLIALIYPFIVFSFSGKGSGTLSDPYQITNIEQLQEINTDLVHLSSHYVIINDIDATITKNWNNGIGFIPIGLTIKTSEKCSNTNPFLGSLNGKNYKVFNLVINKDSSNCLHYGLFGTIGINAQIRNLGLENCFIKGHNVIGGFCGENDGTIINCFVKGKIYSSGINDLTTDYNLFGGFCGLNNGQIINCYAKCNMYFDSYSFNLSILKIGGFCGITYHNSDISCCYADGSIDFTGNSKHSPDIAGFCGDNGHFISNSYSNEQVMIKGTDSSYTFGGFYGGFCGQSFDTIVKCYTSGSFQIIGKLFGKEVVGGFVPSSNEKLNINCFWDTVTSRINESKWGIGLQTEEMMMCSTFLSAGWDFDSIWCMNENRTYPHLRAIEDCNNLVSENNNYQIDKIIEIYSFPNPFSESTTIKYSLPSPSHVKLSIYDIFGRKVAVLVDGWQDKALDIQYLQNIGCLLGSGIYFCRLQAGGETKMIKIVKIE